MEFEKELEEVLPADLPNRDVVVAKAAEHLRLIVQANASMNLTRITSPREAAIKHVLDSVIPWRLFIGADRVLDAGTGAGFPGIPLALVLPEVRFTLADSTGKKARFVESAVAALDLPNVVVSTSRVEDLCRTERVALITARAFAPLNRLAAWFSPALRKGAAALLYKGPDAEREIREAAWEARKLRQAMEVTMRYELPADSGLRTIVQILAS